MMNQTQASGRRMPQTAAEVDEVLRQEREREHQQRLASHLAERDAAQRRWEAEVTPMLARVPAAPRRDLNGLDEEQLLVELEKRGRADLLEAFLATAEAAGDIFVIAVKYTGETYRLVLDDAITVTQMAATERARAVLSERRAQRLAAAVERGERRVAQQQEEQRHQLAQLRAAWDLIGDGRRTYILAAHQVPAQREVMITLARSVPPTSGTGGDGGWPPDNLDEDLVGLVHQLADEIRRARGWNG